MFGMKTSQIREFKYSDKPRTLSDAVRLTPKHLLVQKPGNFESSKPAPVMRVIDHQVEYEAAAFESSQKFLEQDSKQNVKCPGLIKRANGTQKKPPTNPWSYIEV